MELDQLNLNYYYMTWSLLCRWNIRKLWYLLVSILKNELSGSMNFLPLLYHSTNCTYLHKTTWVESEAATKKTRGFPQTLHRNFKFCGMSISCYLEWLTKNTVSNSTGAAFTPSQTMETGAATFNMVKQNKCYDVRMIPNVLQNQRYIFWIASNTVEITLTWTHHIGSCSSFYFLTGFLHIFKNHFPYFFNAFSTLNQKTLIPSIPKIAFMEHNAKQHQQNCHQQ